jgi:excisionase family DNA binding protein
MTVSRRRRNSESVDVRSPESRSDAGRTARGSARDSARPHGASTSPAAGVWDIEEVSLYLKIPVSSIYKMTARKAPIRIPHVRIGNKLRFRQAEVDRWLTLLTVSNLKALDKVQRNVAKVIHGNDSQAEAG